MAALSSLTSTVVSTSACDTPFSQAAGPDPAASSLMVPVPPPTEKLLVDAAEGPGAALIGGAPAGGHGAAELVGAEDRRRWPAATVTGLVTVAVAAPLLSVTVSLTG